MDAATGYALLDAGDGRRLERFGSVVTDRPAPGATGEPMDPGAWSTADAWFDPDDGWRDPNGGPATQDPWPVAVGDVTLELRLAEAGQVGLFPEHAVLAGWLGDRVRERGGPDVLNLFGYTGLATLAAAAAGARVAHVDASRTAVAWARRNAALSGLAERPIRWLTDDAAAFVARERRRGRHYDGIVLDPPAFGHGDRSRRWRLEEDLADLLAACVALATPTTFVLLTAHSVGWPPDRLTEALAGAFQRSGRRGRGWGAIEAGELTLAAASGARLRLGAYARLAP